jgi:predicted transcriptional regulator
LTETDRANSQDFLELTAAIVSAYIENNAIGPADLPKLVRDVHAALGGLLVPAPQVAPVPVPAVSIRRSITPDYLICLEDGRRFKSMKRHLVKLGVTPEQYRAKWSLPSDYPMVAPNYSAYRSSLAISLGLGRKAGETLKPKAQRRTKAALAVGSPV